MRAATHLRQIDLSRRWHMSPRTLEAWRWKGVGPSYIKVRGRIVYKLEDVEAFEKAGYHVLAGGRRA